MALSPGTRFGPYEILAPIGAGGMGVVYEATDTRLGRKVALKVLPDSVRDDPQARERLQREARAASALNHPNICTIYDVGEEAGVFYIVMECMDGEPLRLAVEAQQVSIDRAVDLGIEIADALDTAHSHGIVHRDIKPGNIFVTSRDHAKLLDFGLAKLAPQRVRAASFAATAEELITSPGAAVGTVAYMSPEQARGEDVDARTDLFSLGAVLYQMTTHRMPFEGNSSALVFDAILNRAPLPPSRINPEIPPQLEQIILKLLEKDRDLRYQSAAEVRADLKRFRRDSQSSASGRFEAAAVPVKASAVSRRNLILGAVAVVLIAIVASLVWMRRDPVIATESEWVALTDFSDSAVDPAISADGRMLAFVRGREGFLTSGDVYVKLLPGGDPVQLTHDDSRKFSPTFTPDGTRIAYTSAQASLVWNTMVVPVLGGTAQTFLPNAEGLHWIGDNQILFSEIKTGIHMALETANEGRTSQRDVYVPPTERGMVHLSQISPDHKSVLITEMNSSGEFGPCRVLPFDGSSPGKQIGKPNHICMGVAWSPDGKWMYTSATEGEGFHLWRQRFPDGTPQQITFGPTEQLGVVTGSDGALYTSAGGERQSLWLHRPGQPERQISAQGSSGKPQFSRDGKKLYYLHQVAGRLRSRGITLGTFTVTDLDSSNTEAFFPELQVRQYAISPNQKYAALSALGSNNELQVWIAPLDRRSPPHRLATSGPTDEPFFRNDDEVCFRALDGAKHYVDCAARDGGNRHRILPEPIIDFYGFSPDEKWIVVNEPFDSERSTMRTMARLVGTQTAIAICDDCDARWLEDGTALQLSFLAGSPSRQDVAIPRQGALLPKMPANGLATVEDALKVPGARLMIPENEPRQFAYVRSTVQRNIYRIPVK